MHISQYIIYEELAMIFLRLRENIMLPPHCAPKSVTIGLKRTGHQIDCMIVKLTGYPRSTVKTS